MMVSDQINHYSSLLKIRLSALRQYTLITGGVFLVSMLASHAIGLLAGLYGRSVYLVVALNLAFGSSFISYRVRLEIVKASMELVNNLQMR